MPSTVRDAVLGRAAQLGAAPMQVLQLAAIVPRQVDLQLVADVLAPATEDVEACLASGLLVADGAALRFRHELARTAVEEAILPPRALQLHRRVLAVLAARSHEGIGLARLAHHARLAGDVDAVLRWAPQAAREAGLRGARKEAAAHCRAALAHADRLDDATRAALLDDYATHCFELNDLDAAIPARDQAIELFARQGDGERQADALAAQALALVRALRNADADATSQRALALVESMAPGPHLARAYATESYLRMLNRDLDDAVRWGNQAIDLAERFDDRATLAGAYKTVGAALMFIDDARGAAFVLKSLEMAPPARRRWRRRRRCLCHAVDRVGRGARVRRRRALSRRRHRPRARARPRPACRLHGELAGALRHLPRPLAARRRARPRGRRAGSRGTTNRVVALVALGRLRSRRGDPGALAVLDEALDLAVRSNTLQRLAPVAAARAEAAWLEGRRDDAAREADRAFAPAAQKRHPWFSGSSASGAGAPAAIRARSMTAPRRSACRSKGAGTRRRRPGRRWAPLRAGARARRRRRGGAARGARHPRPARRVPLAEHVRRGMRSAGVRSVPRGALAATRSNAAGLTARELQVLELVAEGCRNADIAARLSRSARTVEHHLESILAKLEVESRVDAVAAARRLGVLAKNG